MEAFIWAICFLTILLGCLVQTALGFGLAIIAAPVIVLLKPEWVPVLITVTALVLSGINAWDTRKDLNIRIMLAPFITRIPGTAAGVWLLLQMNTFWLQIAVSVSVFLAVIISFYSVHFKASTAKLGWAGFFSGFMGSTTSIGGPPMALVMQYGEPRTVRANLSFYFTYSCIVSLIGYAIAGLFTRQLLLESVALIPCSIIGFYLGVRVRDYVDAGRFRYLLLILCSVASIFAFVSALL